MFASLLKIAMVFGLAVTLTAVAAPPRFNNWGAWNQASSAVMAQSAARVPGAEQTKSQTGNGDVEQVEADLIPPALLQPESDPEPPSNRDRRRSTAAKTDEEKSKFSFWSMFKKREPVVPDERTYKEPAALITTPEHHKDDVDLLGIGETRYFGPNINEARWQVSGDRVQCSLRQALPYYGYVAFRQGVKQGLRFELHVKRAPAGLSRARLRSEPPRWKHYARARDLGVVALTTNEQALKAEVAWARRLMSELAEGMQPTLRYWDAIDGTDSVEVQISPVHFQQGLKAFQDCIAQLVEINVAALENTVVHFGFDSAALSSEAQKTLDKLALMLQEDHKVSRVIIEGHTDNRGFRRYNAKLATRRAKSVRQYLITQGVPAQKMRIKLRAFGETKPDASNRTATGRAENRRVEITVHRAADQA